MSRSTSPLPRSADIALEKADLALLPQIELEEENATLRKQVRQLETEYKMTKAVLEQKIELLEGQIEEFRERESNLKKMNESIMFALNDINTKDQNPLIGKAAKELELATEHHNKEIQEIRNRTSEQIKNLEAENKTLKENLTDTELRIKDLKIHFEKAQLGLHQTIGELEQTKVTLETKLKKQEEESQTTKEIVEYELLTKINELKSNNERLKEESKKEIQKLREEYERSIVELKAAHASEKKALEAKSEKSQDLIVQEFAQRDASAAELHTRFHKEIQGLKDLNDQMKLEHQKEVNDLKRQKDDAYDKVEKLDAQVKKLKVTLKTSQHLQEQNSKLLKEKLEKAKGVMEHGENLVSENKKYKQKISELRSQVKNLEASEQKLKSIIQGKELHLDEDTKRKLNFDQSLFNKSLQDQPIEQPKSARQTSGNNLADEMSNQKNNRLSSSTSTAPSFKLQESSTYPQYSPLQESLAEKVSSTLNSQRYERSESPYVTITPPKYSKSPISETIGQKSDMSSRTTEITERKSDKPVPAAIADNLKTENDIEYSENNVSNRVTTTHRMTPLETSFADHGFAIENEMDDLKTEKQKSQENNKHKFERDVDVDTIPITYNEFVKRAQRAKPQMIDPEKILNNEFESNIENSAEDTEHKIFFRTSQDENQPLFGTSHFMMEGLRDDQEHEPDQDDIDTERCILQDKTNKMAEMPIKKQPEKIEQEPWMRKNNIAPEKARVLKTEDDWDFEDLTNIREKSDKERLSVNLNKRDSLAKSFTKDELESRPSLLNPLHTVFDSGSIESFREPRDSLDLSIGNAKSMIERNKSMERQKEKVFSSRHSFSGSVSGAVEENKTANNGSRQKIEGRLKDLEWKLKDMELKNKGLRIEKDKVQLEYEKLMLDLKEKKTESENMKNTTKGEKKEEKEAELKGEIKFLINKLLKVKNKLEKQSEELNTTKTSNILNQSQLNHSMLSGYHLPGKKDYSREYGTLGGSQNLSLSTHIKDRENLIPVQTGESEALNSHRRRNVQTRGTWNEPYSSQLNTSAVKPENYRVSERGAPKNTRSTLGVAIDNAAKDLRSKSITRYELEEDLRYTSINSGTKIHDTSMPAVLSSRSHKAKASNLPKGEEVNKSSGPWLNKEVLRPNININNYEKANHHKNISAGYAANNSFLNHRKSTR